MRPSPAALAPPHRSAWGIEVREGESSVGLPVGVRAFFQSQPLLAWRRGSTAPPCSGTRSWRKLGRARTALSTRYVVRACVRSGTACKETGEAWLQPTVLYFSGVCVRARIAHTNTAARPHLLFAVGKKRFVGWLTVDAKKKSRRGSTTFRAAQSLRSTCFRQRAGKGQG